MGVLQNTKTFEIELFSQLNNLPKQNGFKAIVLENGPVEYTYLNGSWSLNTSVNEYATFSVFPVTGISNKTYIDVSTNKTYRWDGSDYVLIGGGDGGSGLTQQQIEGLI